MQHVASADALAHGHDALRAPVAASERAAGGPTLVRTLAALAHARAGAADAIDVVLRVEGRAQQAAVWQQEGLG